MSQSPGGSLKIRKPDLAFLLFLLAVVVVYALQLFSFTLFEGFTTFGNDAGAYVLVAEQWSPFFDPTDSVRNTLPVQTFPPAFPFLLAFSGASHSLFTGHLLVSVCLLLAVFAMGWMAYRQLGALLGGLMVVSVCTLPGIVISSMGILSENLYLLCSLLVLLVYRQIREQEGISPAWYALFVALLTATILTRSVGIGLFLAVAAAAWLDGGLEKKKKRAVLYAVLLSLVLWQAWGLVDPLSEKESYLEFFSMTTGHLDGYSQVFLAYLNAIMTNLVRVVSAFGQYLSLSHSNAWFFGFSTGLFTLSLLGLGKRLLQGKPDAIYVLLYLAIIVIWPFPNEMMRFLHPIMFLLIFQGVHFLRDLGLSRQSPVFARVAMTLLGVLMINSLVIQVRLVHLKNHAAAEIPAIEHAIDYYASLGEDWGTSRAIFFMDIMSLMKESGANIPAGNVMASVKHEHFALLSDRQTVNLSADVPYLQQLCNLKIRNADVVFISHLTAAYNQKGIKLLEDYRGFSSDVWSLTRESSEAFAHFMFIDHEALDLQLGSYECNSFRDFGG